MGEHCDSSANSAALKTAENGECRPTGTAHAIYTNVPSCERPAVIGDPKGTWGGARNRAHRSSDLLADAKVGALIEAAEFAFATGRVFQRHWIVHYGKAGVRPQNGMRFVSRLLNLVSKQARREGGEMTALWVRECASDKGEHLHVLLHLPAGMRLHGRTRRWIESARDHAEGVFDTNTRGRAGARGVWANGISRIRVIGGRLSKVEESSKAHRENAANVVRYLLKGASEETGSALELTRAEKGGRIIGKRCGWTQNIGERHIKDSGSSGI